MPTSRESSTPRFVRSDVADGRSSRSPPGRAGAEHLRRSVTVTSCGPGAAARAGPGWRMNSGARPGGGPSPAEGGLQLTNRSTCRACYPPAASDPRPAAMRQPAQSFAADMTIFLLLVGSGHSRPRAVIAGHKRPDRADDPHIIDGLSIRFAESAGRRHSGPVAEPHPDTLLRAVILGRPTTSKEARKTHSAVHNVPGTSASRVAGLRPATRPGHRQMRARRAQWTLDP